MTRGPQRAGWCVVMLICLGIYTTHKVQDELKVELQSGTSYFPLPHIISAKYDQPHYKIPRVQKTQENTEEEVCDLERSHSFSCSSQCLRVLHLPCLTETKLK